MLDRLLTYLGDPTHGDDPHVRVDSVVFADQAATIALRVMDRHELETRRSRQVRALGLRDYCLREPYGEVHVVPDHVLARQHTDSQLQLSFSGRPRSAMDLVGDLYIAHRRLTDDWIPFERYLNDLRRLDKLVDGDLGMLAYGPSFLMHGYAAVLEAHGVSASLLLPRPAIEEQLTTLLIGDSFFVAAEFEESAGL